MQDTKDSLSRISAVNKLSRISASRLSEKFTEADVLKQCVDWESSQLFHAQQTNEGCRALRKREQTPLHKEQCDSNENDITESNALSITENTRIHKIIKLKDELLDLQCEWWGCDHRTHNLDEFVRHVSFHIPQLEIRMNEKQESVYGCLWRSCTFECADSNEIVRHVNFHSYHTKIKSIGSNTLSRLRLPVCTFSDIGRNVVPHLPYAFECCWEKCEQTSNNPQIYFNHVQAHSCYNSCGNNVKGRIHCGWRGCRCVFHTISKLADHIRSHTQEKRVGCPTCGGLFATRTKFSDHCKRQVPLELRGYQCLHCFRYYPTKRLLQEHTRYHVNRYKCAFCNMTFHSSSTLSTHIRYRHLDSKPFKCNFCKYTAKRKHDMKSHLTRHCSGQLYRCEEQGCGFSYRSAYGLRKHHDRCHLGIDEPMYCCHICDDRFQRGSLLTSHLLSKHNLCRPSGHCRFKYKCNEDGFFRLQTVRYETLEVTQEVKESHSLVPSSHCVEVVKQY
jgi:hypothetical protein